MCFILYMYMHVYNFISESRLKIQVSVTSNNYWVSEPSVVNITIHFVVISVAGISLPILSDNHHSVFAV